MRQLSEREQQVLHLISHGLTNKQIGDRLFVSEDTVKTHCRQLFRRLGVKDRAHAVRRGFELGLLRGAVLASRLPKNNTVQVSHHLVNLARVLESLGWMPPADVRVPGRRAS